MDRRTKHWILFGLILGFLLILFAGYAWFVSQQVADPAVRESLLLFSAGSLFLLIVVLAILWAALDTRLYRPLAAVVRGAELMARNNTGYQSHFNTLTAAGIPVIDDNRSSIMHNKFFVIDSELVWSGSTNITDNGFSYNHNNSVVFTSTLLADIYTIEFEEMFDGLELS